MSSDRRRLARPMSFTVTRVLVLCGFLTLALRGTAASEPADELMARKLAEFPGADRGQTTAIVDPDIVRVFPNQRFYALRFRQYPVAIAPPGPLGSNNLFVVKPDGSVEHLGDARALERFFGAALPPVTTGDQAKEATKAWLRLVEEFHQDDFFQFSIPDDTLQAVMVSDRGLSATGKATAMCLAISGGNAVQHRCLGRSPTGRF